MSKTKKEFEDDALYIVEVRQDLKWTKLESIFTSYDRAWEVRDKLKSAGKHCRIRRYRNKHKKKRF